MLLTVVRLGEDDMLTLFFVFIVFWVLWVLSDLLERYYAGQFRFKNKDKDGEV